MRSPRGRFNPRGLEVERDAFDRDVEVGHAPLTDQVDSGAFVEVLPVDYSLA